MTLNPANHGLGVLIVEDNALIALELQLHIEGLGHRCVGRHARSTFALETMTKVRPDVGIVDLNLADGRTGMDVVRALQRAGIPAIVISGEARHHSEIHEARAVLDKPLDFGLLEDILGAIHREASRSGAWTGRD